MARLVGINHVALVRRHRRGAGVPGTARRSADPSRPKRARGLRRPGRPVHRPRGRGWGSGPGTRLGAARRPRRRQPRRGAAARAREAGAELRGNDVFDPWGNCWQAVDYRDVQFTKDERVLRGMGLEGLEKSERALTELREKGLA